MMVFMVMRISHFLVPLLSLLSRPVTHTFLPLILTIYSITCLFSSLIITTHHHTLYYDEVFYNNLFSKLMIRSFRPCRLRTSMSVRQASKMGGWGGRRSKHRLIFLRNSPQFNYCTPLMCLGLCWRIMCPEFYTLLL